MRARGAIAGPSAVATLRRHGRRWRPPAWDRARSTERPFPYGQAAARQPARRYPIPQSLLVSASLLQSITRSRSSGENSLPDDVSVPGQQAQTETGLLSVRLTVVVT